MAVNLINSNDIEVEQTGQDIKLKTSTPISTLEGGISDNANNIQNIINGEKYSATETLTNKVWIDGKPIYRATFTITVGTSGGTADISGYSIETITNIIGTMKIQNQNQFRPIPVYGSNSNYNPLEINLGKQISVGSSGGTFSVGTAYITLEYTKTS